jgi:glycosyltransferase involved in cell wall biosynthesis
VTRLAFDATSLLGPRTGIGTFAHELLTRLAPPSAAATDFEVVAFGVTWRGRAGLAGVVPDGVEVATRPMPARPLRELWRRLDGPPLEWWTGAVDVVHGPNFVVPPARGAARIVTVHDLTCLRFPQMCTRDVLQYPDLIRRAVRDGAWVHTVSRAVADQVAEAFAVPPDRLRVVPNGAPTALAPEGIDALATRGRELAGGDRYVLALGTLEPRKDLGRLVEAFDRLAANDPELRLVLAGPDGWGADAVNAAIDAASHRPRIERLGWVDGRARDALLAGASVFAYPSLDEGFGLPPLEAMAHRCPVVATHVGALPEVLGDAAQWAEPSDTESLADAIGVVLDDANRRAVLVRAGLARLDRYRWDETASGMVRLYRDSLDDSR